MLLSIAMQEHFYMPVHTPLPPYAHAHTHTHTKVKEDLEEDSKVDMMLRKKTRQVRANTFTYKVTHSGHTYCI